MTSTRTTPARRRARLLLLAATCLALAAPMTVAATAASPPAEPRAAGTAQVATTPTQAPSAIRRPRPNVVMVMADDMRVDDLRFAPNVRRLIGDDGLRFANSFSPFPLCCPARASFLTGQHSHNHQVLWHGAPFGYGSFDDSRTLATSLRKVGYRTGFVGKYLNGYGKMRSLVSGRRSYRYAPRGWTDWRASIENPGGDLARGDRRFPGSTYQYFQTAYNDNGVVDTSHLGEYQSRTIGDLGNAMVRRFHAQRDPFFLFLSYLAPHSGGPREPDDPGDSRPQDSINENYTTPARPSWVKGRFDRVVTHAAGLPAGGGPAEQDVSDKPTFFRHLPELVGIEKRALRTVTRQRAESVFVMDQQVGRLVAQLKRSGEWRDTVLMFTSDNGYFLGEHRQRTGKVRAHEPSLRVPFLVTGPGMRGGETRYDPITTVDVTATILDLAGARAPRSPDGTSRRTTMLEGDQGWDAPVLTAARNSLGARIPLLPDNPDGDPATPRLSTRRAPATIPVVPASAYPTREERRAAQRLFGRDEKRSSIGLRTPRWSFTLYRNGEGELYDVVADPTQEVNLFSDPEHAETLGLLREEWSRVRDCRGADCHRPMAAELQATPAQQARFTRTYWRGVRAVYGAGMRP